MLLDLFDRLYFTGMLLKYCLTLMYHTLSSHTHDLMRTLLHFMLVTLCTVVICLKYCLIGFFSITTLFFLFVSTISKRYNLIQLNHLRDVMMLCIHLHNLIISNTILLYVN